MSSPVILPTNFDIKNVSFSDPRKNPVGGQSIFLNYKNDNDFKTGPVILQTLKMRIPFGVGVSDLDNSGTLKYALNAALAEKGSENEKLKEFTELIRSIDEHTLKYATNNSEKWFGKVQKAEILEEFYKSAEKKSKNDKYASTIKLKLPIRGKDDKQHPDFKIYDDTKKEVDLVKNSEIDLSCLEKGSEIIAIIQCTGVWFVGKTQFGVGWKIVQIKTFKNKKIVGYSIVDDEEDEEEVEEAEEEEEVEEVEEEEEEVEVG